MKDVNKFIAGITPSATPETSRIKPMINRIVTRVVPINARNAAFLRVMLGVWTLNPPIRNSTFRLPTQRPRPIPDQLYKEWETADQSVSSLQQEVFL